MNILLGYSIWIIVVAALPTAVYIYFRTRRKAAVVMILSASLAWIGTGLALFAEPQLVASEQAGGVASRSYVKGSRVGSQMFAVGGVIFVLGGGYLAATRPRRRE